MRTCSQLSQAEPGEVFIGGDGVGPGFRNRPDQTAERFMANPFNQYPGDRLYRTGDFARILPDGQLAFLGRMDDQIKDFRLSNRVRNRSSERWRLTGG